jgi:maltose/moltooligosaccharide transporter
MSGGNGDLSSSHKPRKGTGGATAVLYRAGTLVYTRMGLVGLFFWLLWGDFCFTLMERVVPTIVPLQLQQMQASNVLIGIVMITVPNAMTCMITPVVSFRSDRFRSRWGRRIPFLLLPTPLIVLLLIGVGWADRLGVWLQQSLLSWMSPGTVALGTLVVLLVGFQFFNLFVTSVYYYLFNDVVPEQFLGRFLAMFRIVGTLANAAYMWFVFPFAQTHSKLIFTGAGLLYLVVFVLMCLKVKEGEYPPPPDNIDHRPGLLSAIKTYAKECFTDRLYWYFFLTVAISTVAGVAEAFSTLRWLSLGLTTGQVGHVEGAVTLISALLLYPAGCLADRYHPLVVMLWARIALIAASSIYLVFLFADFAPPAAFRIMLAASVITLPMMVVYSAAELPAFMRILPRDRYGQFCSATALVRAGVVMVGGLAVGVFMDGMKHLHGGSPFYYRYVPVWTMAFQLIGLVFLILLVRELKRRGQLGGTPPAPESASEPNLCR